MASLQVLETNVLHASDVIYWLDGSTAAEPAAMQRLGNPLNVTLTTRPRDLQWLHGAGKTAFWRRPTGPLVDGVANEAAKTRPAGVPYPLAGVVTDPDGRFHPRRFSLTAGAADGHAIVLYPAPVAVRFNSAGGLLGTLRWADSVTAVPWALLTLTVSTGLGPDLVFRAQASAHGDFLLPTSRLPPLPEGIEQYDAELTVNADPAASATSAADPDSFDAVDLGATDANVFATVLSLPVVPGEIRPVRSFNRAYLAVQPS